MITLDGGFADFRQAKRIDKVDDLAQRCFDDRLARSRDCEAQNRALPQLLIAALRDRDVKLIAHARLYAFQDSALALK